MTEPILPAVELEIGSPILAGTRNAGATLKLLLEQGWEASAHYAIGWTLPKPKTKKALAAEGEGADAMMAPEVAASILVKGTKDGRRVEALWTGQPGDKSFGFDSALSSPPLYFLSYTELTHCIKGTEPKLTPRQEQSLLDQREQMMSAVQAATRIGAPVQVLQTGTAAQACKGKAPAGHPGLPFLPCSGVATNGTLCPGCVTGLIN